MKRLEIVVSLGLLVLILVCVFASTEGVRLWHEHNLVSPEEAKRLAAVKALAARDIGYTIELLLRNVKPSWRKYGAIGDAEMRGFEVIAEPGIPVLASLLESSDSEERRLSARVLAWLSGRRSGRDMEKIASELESALIAGDEEVTMLAAVTLGEIGRPAQVTVESLLTLARKSTSSSVRIAAVQALGKIGVKAEATLPMLSSLVEDRDVDTDVRVASAYAISRFGKEAITYSRSIVQLLSDKAEKVRVAALVCLSEFGEEGKALVPEVIEVLEDTANSAEVRYHAAETLGKIGKDNEAAVIALLKGLGGTDGSVKLGVLEALLDLKSRSVRVTEGLTKVVQDVREESIVRTRAARCIGELGIASKAAVAALEEAAKEQESAELEEAANNALRKITEQPK